jgi:hypothetical protein
MEQEAFYTKINDLYKEIAEQSEENSSTVKKELAEFLFVNNKKWAKYPVQLLETLNYCYEHYDSSRGSFSNMLTFMLHQKIGNTETAEKINEQKRHYHEIPIEKQNSDGDYIYITDKAPPTELHLSEIQKIITIQDIRDTFEKIDKALKEEKENQKAKSLLATREILCILQKQGYELLQDPRVFELGKAFDFSNNHIWNTFFYDIENLPTKEVLAASLGIKKSNATKMMTRFYERLKLAVDKITTV